MCTFPAFAKQEQSIKIIQEQNGNITNIKIEGSLAPTQSLDCISLSEVKATYTPPDLHGAMMKCINIEKYDSAVMLFLLAGIYSRFDAERIVDRSAKAGGRVLIIRTFEKISSEQKALFAKRSNALWNDTSERQELCENVKRIGIPTYFPKYLVLHGLNAYTSKNPLENALVSDFNSQAIWDGLLDTYLHCPK